VAVVNAEEMKRSDLAGGSRTGSRTTPDAIARARHESRNNGDGVLHLFPSPNHRSVPPAHSLVTPSHALLPGRRRRLDVIGPLAVEKRRREDRDGRNLAGAAADGGNVAGAGEVAEIVGAEGGGNGTRGGELRVESFELLVLVHNGGVVVVEGREWRPGGRKRSEETIKGAERREEKATRVRKM